MTDWSGLGIAPATFLLPKGAHLSNTWPIIACDQYTSQPELWQQADHAIGGQPSTLRLIVPEAFLEETPQRSQQVAQAMEDYLHQDILAPVPEGFVLVERTTQSGQRVGLVCTIDLEQYDYQEGSRSLIRATEQTVLERIPPRLQVREQAAIELSHVLLLIDDPQDALLGPLYAQRDSLELLYDIDLLMEGGRIRGWHVPQGPQAARLAQVLGERKRALAPGELLFAVGDGNHSLASAKAAWEKVKASLPLTAQQAHPARYAMVELMNLHSPALLFEPIHRAVFGSSLQAVRDVLAPLQPMEDAAAPDITLIAEGRDLPLRLPGAEGRLVTAAVQELLDQAKLELDYVHGEDALRGIIAGRQAVGILMPDFHKDLLFPTVQRDGRLPRKTFSMGEANEKRFYLEARKIR